VGLSAAAAAKKRSAPNAPAVASQQQQQPIYGTLPHSVGRYQQSYDLSDIYNAGQTNNTINSSDTYSTLPHARNSMTERNSVGSKIQPLTQQFDNKVYERFEPFMMQQSNAYQGGGGAGNAKASHKRSPSSDSITRSINLGNFHSLALNRFLID